MDAFGARIDLNDNGHAAAQVPDVEDLQCSISKLPPQLLVQVLHCAHAANPSCLTYCALVCSAWKEAAVAATSVISLAGCNPIRCNGLNSWLQAHKAAAPLSSISIGGTRCTYSSAGGMRYGWLHLRPQVLLPMPYLHSLRDLQLSYVDCRSSESSKQHRGDPYSPLQQAPLPSLTRLELRNCAMRLQGLGALTGLQHLTYKAPRTESSSSRNNKVLARALPALVQLTHLALGGPACTARVTAQLSTLPALQELVLQDCEHSAAMLRHLPAQLTRLEATFPAYKRRAGQPLLMLNPSTAASLQGLTGLQVLRLHSSGEVWVYPSVLRQLQELRELTVNALQGVAFDGSDLSDLTRLTKLQHLALPSPGALGQAANLAALTSSPQVTALVVPSLPLRGHFEQQWFPMQHTLQDLQELWCSEALLLCLPALYRAAYCCSNLRHLHLEGQATAPSSFLLPNAKSAVRILADFPKLRSLKWVAAQLLDLKIWQGLARLPALQSLEVSAVDGHRLAHAVELAACSSLTRLHIAETFVERPHTWRRQLNLLLVNEAPADSPPDVASSVPSELLVAARKWYEFAHDARDRAELFLQTIAHLLHSKQGRCRLQTWVRDYGECGSPHCMALLLRLAEKRAPGEPIKAYTVDSE